MDKVYIKGEILQLETSNGAVLQGYFHSQNSDKTKISLYKVKDLPNGEVTDVISHFFNSEIRSITRVPVDCDLNEKLEKTLKLSTEDYTGLLEISKKFIFINQIDNTFHEALDDLKHYDYIAVGSDCSDMGRKCKLPILTVSTPSQIYIFDVQVMQYHAFDGGLKSLLESEYPKKIVHDCRKLSDCLYHKHNVTLNSVFDTQVGDVIISNQKTGQLPTKVRTLQECLTAYLGIPAGIMDKKIGIEECSTRPLSLTIKEMTARNIVCLHQLSERVHAELMRPFMNGVACYVEGLRGADDFKAWRAGGRDLQLPEDFQDAIEY